MSDVTFENVVSSSGGTGNFIASVVSTNFNNVMVAVNSGGMNSDNYGFSSAGSGFESSNISINQVVSQHITNDAVVSQKFADSAVAKKKMEFRTASNGVLALQLGPKPTPAGGVMQARMSHSYTFSETYPTTITLTVQYSDAYDGDPGFTEAPIFMGEPLIDTFGTAVNQYPRNFKVVANDSASCQLGVYFDGVVSPAAGTNTVNFEVMGGV
jgi:hypothetical protein